jgi:hypothetical protein
MKERTVFAGTYILQRNANEKGFGYVQGYAYLPDYSTKVKIYINSDRFETESDVDNTQLFTLDRDELEAINRASQFIDNSLKILISLAKRDLLKDEFFGEE